MMSLLTELLETIEKIGVNWRGVPLQSDKFYWMKWGEITGVFDSVQAAEERFRNRTYHDDDDGFLSTPSNRVNIIATKDDAEDAAYHPEDIDYLITGEDNLIIKGSILKAWMHRFPKIKEPDFFAGNEPYSNPHDPNSYYRSDLASKIERLLNDFDFESMLDHEIKDVDLINKIRSKKFIDFKLVHGVEKARIKSKSEADAVDVFKKIRAALLGQGVHVYDKLGIKQVSEPHSFGVSRWVGAVRTTDMSDEHNSIARQQIPLYIVLEHFKNEVHLTIYPQRLLPNAIQRLLRKR